MRRFAFLAAASLVAAVSVPSSAVAGSAAAMVRPVAAVAVPAPTLAEAAADRSAAFAGAVQAAGLDALLGGTGPYTVFAPDDAAFAALPDGGLAALMAPARRNELTRLLTAHVVPGAIGAGELRATAAALPGGVLRLTALSGDALTVRLEGDALIVTDAAGSARRITAPDGASSNGVLHGVDGVLGGRGGS